MADTTTPVTLPAQDLQINLEDAPKAEVKIPENTAAELDLSLDLNLPEIPKTDDRLKAEDQKNKEIEKHVEVEPKIETMPEEIKLEEIPVAEKAPVIENLFAEMPAAPVETKIDETPIAEVPPTTEIAQKEVTEQSEGIPQGEEVKEEIPVIPETPTMEEVPTQEITPSTSIEKILPTPEKKIQEPIIEPETFKEDMKIIDELEGHASAGGLSPEATVLPQAAPVETPKTFDLDAMLGPVNAPAETSVIETVIPVVVAETPVMTMPEATPTPVPPPAFTIPTTQQTSVQAMPQVTIPAHKKTSGVKALLFVVLFAALGFTTYFIIQTMYPVEMGNMFGGGDTTQMHASEEVSGDIATTGETQELTGDETEIIETTGDTTGTIDSAGNFGELNDLGTPTTTETTEETDLSKLADYVNKGNDLRDQGKALNNNTVIKYGLYISKKATDLLEKIAKGEEITNLSGYFAQFDQYITQLEALIGSTGTVESSSPELPTNDTPTTTGTEPAPTTDPFAAE